MDSRSASKMKLVDPAERDQSQDAIDQPAKEQKQQRTPSKASKDLPQLQHLDETTKLSFDTRKSLRCHISALHAAYEATQAQWPLDALAGVMEKIAGGAENLRLENDLIRLLIESNDPLDIDDCEAIYREVTARWPKLQRDGVSPAIINIVSRLICELGDELFITYQNVPLLLSEYAVRHKTIEHIEESDPAQKEQFRAAYESIKRYNEFTNSITTKTADADKDGKDRGGKGEVEAYIRLFKALLAKLQEAHAASLSFQDDLVESSGDTGGVELPAQLWQRFGNTLDYDVAKAAWMQNVKWMTLAVLHQHNGLHHMLGEIIELLKGVVDGDT